MDTTVYLPTYRRVKRQPTWQLLKGTPWAQAGRVHLVAVPDEVKALRAEGYPVIECPAQGIGPTRQWLLDNHDVDALGPFMMMMDDDLKFCKRRFDVPEKFWYPKEPDEIQLILDRLRAMLDQVPLAGLDNRSGANRRQPPVQMYGRAHDLHCLNVPVAREAGVRYDRIRFMEDFDVILQFLTAGYPTAMLTTHCKDDAVGSNADGGCSEYRDADGQAAAALALYENFPDFVRIVRRPGKSWGGDMQYRTDVQVQWKKAFKAGVELREDLGLPQHPEPDWSSLAPEWDVL